MTGLPWVRLDTTIPNHDKILALKADVSQQKWQAIASYCMALAWSGGAGTDGFIPVYALDSVHGSTKTARLLVKYGLWEKAPNGYLIRNYDQRQQLNGVTQAMTEALVTGGKKGACVKWHGAGCWRNGRCRREEQRLA